MLRYLDFDPRYERFLNAWVFGETGTLVRHGAAAFAQVDVYVGN